jgi:hypothetical protein
LHQARDFETALDFERLASPELIPNPVIEGIEKLRRPLVFEQFNEA